MIGRIVKRLLHRVIRAVIVYPAARIAAALVLIAIVGFGIYQIVSGVAVPVALPTGSASRSDAAEQFLKGNQLYDATMVWESLNEESHRRLESAGGPQLIQAQLNAAKEQGTRLEQITYIGQYSLPDGTTMQFYLVASRSPLTGGQLEYIPYVFTIDQSGKIAKVQ